MNGKITHASLFSGIGACDLAISFGKWRTESIKAYGNAIVPQVIYEIFKAIEKEMYNV